MIERTDFLNSLHQRGVMLWLDRGQLRYRAKKGTITAEDIATLQAMKDDIVGMLKEWKSFNIAPLSIGKKKQLTNLVPLTAQQEMFWNTLQRGALSYLDPSALRISGPLNAELLIRVFEEIIGRHDSLRTRIVLVNGIPKQKIDESCQYNIKVMDLSALPEAEVSARIQEVVEEVLNQGCNMANEPLFEVKLIKLGEANHLLIWSIHHMIYDLFSNILVFRELWLSYSELSQGRPSPLQFTPMQYADYALWQEEAKRSWPEKDEPYWKERLTGATSVRWPTRDNPSAMTPELHVVSVSFCHGLSDKLRELAAAAGATLGMVVLAVYAIVVSQWCNQKDFVLTTTTTGRDRSELETMTGYCSYFLYLRVQLNDSESFIDLLNKVSQEFYGGLMHQAFRLATENSINLPVDTFFQWLPWQPVEFVGMPMPHESATLDVVVEPFPIYYSLERNAPLPSYSNAVTLWDTSEGIAGYVSHAASLYSEAEYFSQKLRLVAEQVVDNPYTRVASAAVAASVNTQSSGSA